MLLSLEEVQKSYGASLVFEDVTARIEPGDKIGLLGANGAGKSTLLNVICGDLDHDGGSVSRAESLAIGFLRQNSGLSGDNSIIAEMTSVFDPLLEIGHEMTQLGEEISKAGGKNPRYDEMSARYATLQGIFEQRGGYNVNVKINTVLNGMGFLGTDRETLVGTLSGGEKTRLAICKLLLEEPELLILDEPTNHLDFKTLSWLEEYLTSYTRAVLVVSHDRYFLDKVCKSIWDLENHALTVYKGGYGSFVAQKEARLERLQKEYGAQQAEIANLKDFVAKNLVRASTTARAQSRRKILEKMELVKKPKPPPKPAHIRFKYRRDPVKDVLRVEGVSLSVGEGAAEKQLINNMSFELTRGEKLALIGANGIGKSSFLKAILGLLPVRTGYIEWGKNTDISYFEQEDFALDSEKTALNELWDRFPGEYERRIRTVLGGVGLSGENALKKIGELSGGERAKLKFAMLMLSCGNVLIMDEPTNHLDLSAKEALDSALCQYSGTLIVVSHDRYLLNKFPTAIAEMNSGGFTIYKGNYDAYLSHKSKESPTEAEKTQQKKDRERQSEYYRSRKQRSADEANKRRVLELEGIIEGLELDIWRLENEISQPEIASDYVLLKEKCDEAEEKRAELDAALNEWMLTAV